MNAMNENLIDLIEKVKQWGIDKGITGPNGKATPEAQAKKMMEEATETAMALGGLRYAEDPEDYSCIMLPVIDGIGDTLVTVILLCEVLNLTIEECLQAAYDEIKGRTGTMKDGVFVKDK